MRDIDARFEEQPQSLTASFAQVTPLGVAFKLCPDLERKCYASVAEKSLIPC